MLVSVAQNWAGGCASEAGPQQPSQTPFNPSHPPTHAHTGCAGPGNGTLSTPRQLSTTLDSPESIGEGSGAIPPITMVVGVAQGR